MKRAKWQANKRKTNWSLRFVLVGVTAASFVLGPGLKASQEGETFLSFLAQLFAAFFNRNSDDKHPRFYPSKESARKREKSTQSSCPGGQGGAHKDSERLPKIWQISG